MELRIAGIVKDSVVDGPGLRFVIFTQGCPHNCLGCHNPETHDPMGGKIINAGELMEIISKARLIRGVTFSGGEPFLQAKALVYLADMIRARGLNIVTYTGYTFEQLMTRSISDNDIKELLYKTDILVDGPFQLEKRDLRLAFRGSANQRLINVADSLKNERVVLWEDFQPVCINA